MAADTNVVALVGRLTADAESKVIGENTVHNFRLAFTTRYKNGGEWEDKSNYIGVSLWGSPKLSEYLVKGKQVALRGELEYREWEKDGNKRSVIELRARDVQFLGGTDSREAKPSEGDDGSDIPF
jgi:single-strand DNA-binding protein